MAVNFEKADLSEPDGDTQTHRSGWRSQIFVHLGGGPTPFLYVRGGVRVCTCAVRGPLRVVGGCVRRALAGGPGLPGCVNKLKQQIMFKSISLRPGKCEIHYSWLLLPGIEGRCVRVCVHACVRVFESHHVIVLMKLNTILIPLLNIPRSAC